MNLVESIGKPIHSPGSIQSFGYLIGIDIKTYAITVLSENIKQLFNIDSLDLYFGKKISDFPLLFQSIIESDIFKTVSQLTKRENETYFDKIYINQKQYHFSLFRSNHQIFFEFEEVCENLHKRITNKYDNFYIVENGHGIWDLLLNTIATIISYDRIMVYKFLDDGSAKVIAEKKEEQLESFLGLHYPETDTPKQARDLFSKKRKRIFSNVNAKPIRLISTLEEEIDLTYVNARTMSPIHGKYIKNTGSSSNFSISIIIDNVLWGIVNCQNTHFKHIDLEDRVQAGVFTVLAANAYSSYRSKKELKSKLDLDKKVSTLKSDFLKYSTLFESLVGNKSELMKLPKADGLAIVSHDCIITEGTTPSIEMINRIVDWAYDNTSHTIFISHTFLRDYQAELDLDEKAAGIVIYFGEKSKGEVLIWFRSESKKYINWAGNPGVKRSIYSAERTPKSTSTMDVFTEELSGLSEKWSHRDELAVHSIRDVILETSHKQNNLIKKLNEQLRKLNEELDTFSYTISHDLGTPLTVMKLNAQMLLKNLADESEKNKSKLNSIISEIDNMARMMQDVLQLSKAKQSEIELIKVQTSSTIAKLCEDAKMTFESPNCEIQIKDCPDVLADKTMLYQVFLNIINNAVKYSSHQTLPKVTIEGRKHGKNIIYKITDNGIGIPEVEKEKMFKIFSRMDNAKQFKGNGIGLTIVHRIMQRIGGSVDYTSSEHGTCFMLTFQEANSIIS